MINIIDKYYLVGVIIVLIIEVILILCILKVLNARIKKRENQRDVRKINREKNKRAILGNIAIVLLFLIGYGGSIKYNFRINDKFIYKENGDIDIATMFCVKERIIIYDDELIQSGLHLDIIKETLTKSNGVIDNETLQSYKDYVENVFERVPYEENKKSEEYTSGIFEEKLKNFSTYVNMDKEGIAPEDLWLAYQDGREVIKVYNTSSNIFQLAVLAEAAHANEYARPVTSEQTEVYLAGAIEMFERFLDFKVRDAGNGTMIDIDTISFRIGKMVARESKKEKDLMQKKHYYLYAYSLFDYSLSCINIDDVDYLCYLFYCSEAAINILQYMPNDEEKVELCEVYIDMWDEIDEDYFQTHSVENKSQKEVKQMKKNLEDKRDRYKMKIKTVE